MQTKLTLRLDDRLIKRIKAYSMQTGKSISQIVADYFEAVVSRRTKKDLGSAPITESLRGVLKGSGVDEKSYRRHLEEKHL